MFLIRKTNQNPILEIMLVSTFLTSKRVCFSIKSQAYYREVIYQQFNLFFYMFKSFFSNFTFFSTSEKESFWHILRRKKIRTCYAIKKDSRMHLKLNLAMKFWKHQQCKRSSNISFVKYDRLRRHLGAIQIIRDTFGWF